jgi:alkaline phosphatase
MNSGIKTYNAAINVDYEGRHVVPIARRLQKQGFSIGIVTSVPISHATPAAVYANNVNRNDYQDLSRDLLGLRSRSHRSRPLPGVDVLLGCGWGETREEAGAQGNNFVPGNLYITDNDLRAIDVEQGGKYRIVQRTVGKPGSRSLMDAARQAYTEKTRLFGLFGVTGGNGRKGGHLPYQTADGGFNPVGEKYSRGDLQENPTLADMTRAALGLLSANRKGFWLMIEAGDVDWANHSNNIDDSIGAVLSGDQAFQMVTRWAEKTHAWDDTLVIVTADHGHYFVLDDPSVFASGSSQVARSRGG